MKVKYILKYIFKIIHLIESISTASEINIFKRVAVQVLIFTPLCNDLIQKLDCFLINGLAF